MTITVLLFARARELVGQPSVLVRLPDGATIGQLRKALAADHPRVAVLVAKSTIAVDEVVAADGVVLCGSETIALLPPVSGGAT